MFSDAHVPVKVALAVLLLAVLGLYYARRMTTMPGLYPNIVAEAKQNDGRPMRMPIWDVVAIQGPDRMLISKNVSEVPVDVDTTGLRVGDTVSIVGHFRGADGLVVVEELEVHHLRKLKEALGILGAVLSVVLAPLGFRVVDRRLVENA